MTRVWGSAQRNVLPVGNVTILERPVQDAQLHLPLGPWQAAKPLMDGKATARSLGVTMSPCVYLLIPASSSG